MRNNKKFARIITLAIVATLFSGITVNAAQEDFSFDEESVSVLND